MGKAISIDKKLYENINCVVSHNDNEQMMLLGANTINDKIVIDSGSLKWFSEKEIIYHDGENFSIDEGLLVKNFMQIADSGHDSVIMLHSHPGCINAYDDFIYGSLSETDVETSKKLLLVCQFKNVNYYDAISTGNHIYFWSIDNENMIPKQLNCYIDGELVKSRVPSTIQELVDVVRRKK